MPLPVYMDVHVPAAISSGLRRRGMDVLTSQEDGTSQMQDEALLDRATHLGRVLFSKDDDLLRIAASLQRTGKKFNGVLYAHQLSGGIGRLIDDLQLVLECCGTDELADQVIHLPLR